MDSKWAAVLLLLLLLLNWGHTEAGSWGEDQVFAVSEHPAAPPTQLPPLPQLSPRLLRSSKGLASKGGKWLLSPCKSPLEAILSLHVFMYKTLPGSFPATLITGRR